MFLLICRHSTEAVVTRRFNDRRAKGVVATIFSDSATARPVAQSDPPADMDASEMVSRSLSATTPFASPRGAVPAAFTSAMAPQATARRAYAAASEHASLHGPRRLPVSGSAVSTARILRWGAGRSSCAGSPPTRRGRRAGTRQCQARKARVVCPRHVCSRLGRCCRDSLGWPSREAIGAGARPPRVTG